MYVQSAVDPLFPGNQEINKKIIYIEIQICLFFAHAHYIQIIWVYKTKGQIKKWMNKLKKRVNDVEKKDRIKEVMHNASYNNVTGIFVHFLFQHDIEHVRGFQDVNVWISKIFQKTDCVKKSNFSEIQIKKNCI